MTKSQMLQWQRESIEQAMERYYGDLLASYSELGSLTLTKEKR